MPSALIGVVALLGLVVTATPDPDTVMLGEASFHRYEWRASTFARSTQSEAALAVDGQGNIVAAWSSRRQRAGHYGVYAQRFTPQGVAVGQETCLSLWPESHQSAPAVAFDTAGWLWTVWQSHGQDGVGGAIIARSFDTGGEGGSEVLVNQSGQGHESDPVVAVVGNGSALVVWTSVDARRPARVRARRLGLEAAATGDEIPVSLATDGWASSAGIAASASGDAVVVYAVADAGQRPRAIIGRSWDAREQAFGEPIDISGPGAVTPIEPVIAVAPDGYVVAWLEPAGGAGDYAVRARRLDVNGCPAGDPFEVDPSGGGHSAPAVAAADDGRFAIAFNAPDGEGSGVFVRSFSADGTPMGPRTRLTRHWRGDQSMRQAAGTRRLAYAGDRLVCVWDGDGDFGDSSSVNVTMLTPARLAGADRGVTSTMKPAGAPVVLAMGPTPHQPPVFDPRHVAADVPRETVLGPAGLGFTAINSTGWTPPDPHMAVGPEHVVVMTNGAIAFFTKTGVFQFQDQIEGAGGFWGSLGATGFVFDPEVIYDDLSGRFFAMASERAPADQSFALVAVSDDSDPNGTWHKYRFETTVLAGDTFDSPNIGVDADTMYLTGDGFGGPVPYPVFAYDKASLLAGDPPGVTNSFSIPTTTQSAGMPPVSYDDPPALYLIEHSESGAATTVRLIAIQDALTSPTMTFETLSVPVYGPPEDPPQMGTSARPETFDARFWSVAYRNGSLWATHHVNTSRVRARWYEIAMNGWPDSGMTPTLVQSGEIDPGPDVRTFFSAITVDDHGNAAMVFARGAPTEFFSMATAYRYASDPLGTFRPDVIHQTNTGPYEGPRWGDYGAINVDPLDSVTMWAHHEYAVGNSWVTWIAQVTPSFDPADLNLDGMVGLQDFLLLLAAWGPCPSPPAPCPADLDGDGEVGIVDFLQLLAGWG